MAKKPKGFERAGLKHARNTIESLMSEVKDSLDKKGIQSKSFVHKNKDDSIDAELSFSTKRGVPSSSLLKAIERSLPKQTHRGLWVSAGVRFSYEDDEDKYTRNKGLSQVQTNYRRYQPAKVALVALTTSVISTRVEKRVRRKISNFFIRLNWNPDNSQPKRR